MKQRNVCKFSALTPANSLEIRCFVLETDQSVIAQRVQLQWHRAYLFTQGDGEFRTNGPAVPFRSGMLIFGFESDRMKKDQKLSEIDKILEIVISHIDKVLHIFDEDFP